MLSDLVKRCHRFAGGNADGVQHRRDKIVEGRLIVQLAVFVHVVNAQRDVAGVLVAHFQLGRQAPGVRVGLMSGEVGSTDPARTSGNEIFNAVTPTTEQRAALAALVAVEPAGVARSIGVRFSGNVAANAATKLHFRITYATGR